MRIVTLKPGARDAQRLRVARHVPDFTASRVENHCCALGIALCSLNRKAAGDDQGTTVAGCGTQQRWSGPHKPMIRSKFLFFTMH